MAVVRCSDSSLHGVVELFKAADALDQAVIGRYGRRGGVPEGLHLRSDNGSIFLAEHYLTCVKLWGIEQEYTPGKDPKCNGVIERFFKDP